MRSKNLNTSLGVKKRKGLDNELGKIIFSTNIGILDSDANNIPLKVFSKIASIHPVLPKFLFVDILTTQTLFF